MSKGYSGFFSNTKGTTFDKRNPINKVDYNKAESIDVGKVNEVHEISSHGAVIKDIPNSVGQKYNEKGSIISERYYNNNGDAYLDIDYTNHGNSKTHPNVPHQHKIIINKKRIIREKGVKIRK